jgi:hypothetical protein
MQKKRVLSGCGIESPLIASVMFEVLRVPDVCKFHKMFVEAVTVIFMLMSDAQSMFSWQSQTLITNVVS